MAYRRRPLPRNILPEPGGDHAPPSGPAPAPVVPHPASPLEPLLHPDAVAEALGVGRRTLRRLNADGKLRSLKVRGAVRYRRADVEEYLERIAEEQAAAIGGNSATIKSIPK